MKNVFFAGAAGLAMAFTPMAVGAQDMGNDMQMEREAYNMSPDQQQMYMSWEDDQRIAYQRWDPPVQEYYWTLDDTQRDAWWLLNDDQRMQVFNLAPAQRMAAWDGIMRQMNAMNAQTATTTNTAMANNTASSGNIRFVSSTVVQPTPADAGPPTGDVPICDSGDTDNCINAWEAGERGPSVTKPLDYFPGPAGPNPRQ